jgi:hypothetical protein
MRVSPATTLAPDPPERSPDRGQHANPPRLAPGRRQLSDIPRRRAKDGPTGPLGRWTPRRTGLPLPLGLRDLSLIAEPAALPHILEPAPLVRSATTRTPHPPQRVSDRLQHAKPPRLDPAGVSRRHGPTTHVSVEIRPLGRPSLARPLTLLDLLGRVRAGTAPRTSCRPAWSDPTATERTPPGATSASLTARTMAPHLLKPLQRPGAWLPAQLSSPGRPGTRGNCRLERPSSPGPH